MAGNRRGVGAAEARRGAISPASERASAGAEPESAPAGGGRGGASNLLTTLTTRPACAADDGRKLVQSPRVFARIARRFVFLL